MEITPQRLADTLTLSLNGRLDMSTAVLLESALDPPALRDQLAATIKHVLLPKRMG